VKRGRERGAFSGWSSYGRPIPALLLTLATSGCFTWSASDPAAIPVGEQLRVWTTREGGADIVEATGRDLPIPHVEGRLVARESGVLDLRVPIGDPLSPGPSRDLSQIVRIPLSEILSAEERRFSRGRTVAFIGGSTALATVLVVSLMDRFGSGSVIDPGDEVLSRSPIPSASLSFPVRLGPR